MLKNRKGKLLFFIVLFVSPMIILIFGFSKQSVEPVQQTRVINNNVVKSSVEIVDLMNTANVLVKPVSAAVQKVHAPVKYDLLINSYMNSGSRFTGQLFGFRTGAFYVYEPLWRFSVWDYYHGDNLVCSSTQGSINCSRGSANSVNKKKDRGRQLELVKNVAKNDTIVDMMVAVLDDIYSCNFSRLENMFVPNVQDLDQLAGPGWTEYRACLKSRTRTKMVCLKQQEQKCRNASHTVTKVLRLTTGSYEKLLEKRKNLKIIHLFRNPFAIINSRTESKGYPVKDFNSNAAVLCKKMMLDYEGGMRLSKKFPDRVKFVFYEDIKSNVTEKMEKLYKYIGMELDMNELKKLNRVQTNKAVRNTPSMSKTRVTDNAHWWRSHMSYLRYHGIKDKCKQVMTIFQLTDFNDRQTLLQLNISEMNLPEILRI